MNKQEILNAYKNRFATKLFLADQKISDEDFNFILETGRLSPSSFGWEPWKFVVVQNPEVRELMKTAAWGAQGTLPTASHFVMILSKKMKHTKAGSEYLFDMSRRIQNLPEDIVELKMGFFDTFQKEHFDLTDDRKLFDWAAKQAYIPLGNMMTAAAQIGIDSCPIEGFDREALEVILEKEGILNREDYGVAVMAAFGYHDPEGDKFPKTRRAMDEVVQWIE